MNKDPRFKNHDALPEQVNAHYHGARERLNTAIQISDSDQEAAYEMAYEAVLKASIAILFKNGLRPRSLPGHHIAILEKANELLGDAFNNHFNVFDEMRRSRNDFIYDADGFVSSHEVKEAIKLVDGYLKKVGNYLK